MRPNPLLTVAKPTQDEMDSDFEISERGFELHHVSTQKNEESLICGHVYISDKGKNFGLGKFEC